MKNKKKLICIFIFLIFIMIGLFYVLKHSPYNEALKKIDEINNLPDTQEDTHTIDIYKVIKVYDGELSTKMINKTYENLATNVIPRYYKKCKDLEENKIEKYYKNNKKTIKVELGIEEQEEFVNFITYLKNAINNEEDLKLESTRIVGESIKNRTKYTEAYIEINYEKDIKIVLNSHISKKKTTDITPITYSVNVNNDILEAEEKVREEEKKELEKINSQNNMNRGHGVPIQSTK